MMKEPTLSNILLDKLWFVASAPIVLFMLVVGTVCGLTCMSFEYAQYVLKSAWCKIRGRFE